MADITVSCARQCDLPSLTTIVTRSFHPVNAYIKQALPDTPKVRAWWSRIFQDEIRHPNCHVLVASDNTTNNAIGILTLRLLAPDERGAGFWTKYQPTEDHDHEKHRSMVGSMVEQRERIMMGAPHYLIELFGVDHAYKGRGIGKKLLALACDIADDSANDVFVQANASAKGFYVRKDFQCESESVMPGEAKYTEYMMVRRWERTIWG